jgi:hypothetical protein
MWWGFGGESPEGDLELVAREFIRWAEMRCGSSARTVVTVLREIQ